MCRAFLAVGLIIALQRLAPVGTAAAQTTAAAAPTGTTTSPLPAHVTVLVPTPTTELRVQNEVLSSPTGTSRTIETRPLEAGRDYDYTFVAEWTPSNYEVMTRTQTVRVHRGDTVVVDLTHASSTDRMRIRYVATPDEVVAMMVDLAGVTSSDVVFEPGCGDARITIAAVQAGARRGVGIDIDAALVARAQQTVRMKGLQDTVDIRLGDALDIKDLSEATVVFLYMSDEFDVRLRPILWRDLKVGTRIVSHRFTMGDWMPDRTINVLLGDGFPFTLHLWTITPEVKARAAKQD